MVGETLQNLDLGEAWKEHSSGEMHRQKMGVKTHTHRQVLVVMGGVDSAQASNSPTLHFPVGEPPQCSSPCERKGEQLLRIAADRRG